MKTKIIALMLAFIFLIASCAPARDQVFVGYLITANVYGFDVGKIP